MKKTFFTLMLLAAVSFMSAQNLQFEKDGEVYQDGQTIIAAFEDFEYVTHLHIRNLTDNGQDVMVEQNAAITIEGVMAYMCWDQCLAPSNFLVDGPVTIPAQSLSDNELSGHVMFDEGVSAVVTVTYTAYDRANPDERVSINVLFGPNAGTEEYTVNLGQAYPNPASSQVHFDFSGNDNSSVKAVIYNLLGQEVKSQFVSGNQGSINFNVDDLQPGIYFCSFQIGNEMVRTEKFIVKR
jgi:hypothetical protein